MLIHGFLYSKLFLINAYLMFLFNLCRNLFTFLVNLKYLASFFIQTQDCNFVIYFLLKFIRFLLKFIRFFIKIYKINKIY